MIDHNVFYRYQGSDGRILVIYTDVNKLEAHMKQLSPQDSETIELFCRLIRKFTKFQMPIGKPFELYNIFDIVKLVIRMMPFNKDLNFCNSITLGEFGKRFKDPLLREVFPKLLWEPDYTLISIVMTLALMHIKAGGFPEGGSLEFARAIEKRFLDLGGKAFYKCRVGKILEDNGRAIGIRLADGRGVKGDYVISAADLQTTLYQMLEGKHVDPMHEELFRTCKVIPSSVQVSFGVNMDLSSQPESLGELWNPKSLGTHDVDWMLAESYCFDPTMTPPGKSFVKCIARIEDLCLLGETIFRQ